MFRAIDCDLIYGVSPSSISTLIPENHLELFTYTIEELSDQRKEAYKALDSAESFYLYDRDPCCEYHPQPFYTYDLCLAEVRDICLMLQYKMLCKDRYQNGGRHEFTDEQINSLIFKLREDPGGNYVKIVKDFTDVEIELVFEHMLETKEIRYKRDSKKSSIGWRVK